MGDFSFIGYGLKRKDENKAYNPNFNVVNIMRSLIEDKNNVIYIPFDYKKGSSSKTFDPAMHFLPAEAGRPLWVSGIQSNQERFNFSFTGTVDVGVEVANEDGTTKIVMKKVFRNYNVIRDNDLVIKSLKAKLSPQSFEDLRDSEVLWYKESMVPKSHVYSSDFVYEIKLDGIPLVSHNWAQPNQIGLYEYMEEENLLASRIKALKELIKQYKLEGQYLPSEPGDSEFYNETYSHVDSNKPTEEIEVPCVVYEFNSIKKIEFDMDILRKEYPTIVKASREQKDLNKRLINIRFIMRCVVFAIEESYKKGSYDWTEPELVKRSKEKYEQFAKVLYYGVEMTLRRLSYKKKISVDV